MNGMKASSKFLCHSEYQLLHIAPHSMVISDPLMQAIKFNSCSQAALLGSTVVPDLMVDHPGHEASAMLGIHTIKYSKYRSGGCIRLHPHRNPVGKSHKSNRMKRPPSPDKKCLRQTRFTFTGS